MVRTGTLLAASLLLALAACSSSSDSGAGSSSGSSSGTSGSSGDGSSGNDGSSGSSSGASGGASSGSSGGSSGSSSGSSGGGNDGGTDAGPLPPPDGAPNVLYTDIASGPGNGGEGDKGAYLSIFGKNFGAGGLGTTLKVTIGGAEVAGYVSVGHSRGRDDVEQLIVRVGTLGGKAPGTAMPIQVTVGGVGSNVDHTFMLNPGRILYVDPAKGDDATGTPGDVTKPYKTFQSSDLTKGAWGQVKPGDTLVLRGGTYTSVGREQYFMRFSTSGNNSGTAPTGQAGSGPIAVIGYPGEDAFVNCTAATHPAGCFSGLNGENYPKAGKWAVIANLRIEGGGYDGPISQEIYGDDWRIVNNELTAFTGVTSGASPSRMAGITGNGKNAVWMGNHIHDIQGSQYEAHGIYIDGDGSYDIGFNLIHDIKSGKGIQTFANGGNGSDVINDVRIHHNVVHDTLQFGINIADGSTNGFLIYDNVVYRTKTGGLRFNTNTLKGCKVYANTFYDTNTGKNTSYGSIMSDWTLTKESLDVQSNIFFATQGTHATGGSVGIDGTVGTFANNVWFGSTDKIDFDKSAVTSDPKFVNPGSDLHLQVGSPALGAGSAASATVVKDDYDLVPRGAKMDIGAYQLSK